MVSVGPSTLEWSPLGGGTQLTDPNETVPREVGEVAAAADPRARLNEELGFYPAGTDPESVARHRREAAADAASHAEWLRQYGPDGYRRNQYRHLVERKRQEAVEAAGRAAVADPYR